MWQSDGMSKSIISKLAIVCVFRYYSYIELNENMTMYLIYDDLIQTGDRLVL